MNDDDEMLDQVVRDNPVLSSRKPVANLQIIEERRGWHIIAYRHGHDLHQDRAIASDLRSWEWADSSREAREHQRALQRSLEKAGYQVVIHKLEVSGGGVTRDQRPWTQSLYGYRGNPVRGELQRGGEPPPPAQQFPIRQLRAWGLPQWLDYGTVVHDFQSEDPLIVIGFQASARGQRPWVPYAFVENQRSGRRDYVVTARLRRSRQLNPARQANPVATKRFTHDDLLARLRARGVDTDRSGDDEDPSEQDLSELYGQRSGTRRRANPEPEAPCEHACSRRPNPSKSEKENPIVKGDEASFLVVRAKGEEEKSDDEREIRIDPKLQVVHDPDEKIFSKCDAMFVRVLRSAPRGNPHDTEDASAGTDQAQKYYPYADLTPDETLDHPKGPWQRVAKIDGIRYRRWFDEHDGKGYKLVPFEHHFETPCVLETVSGKRAYRLRLGSGCVWDERGLVIP
jgi:hypothetical protein